MFGKIDLNDAVVSPFFVIAAGVSAELFNFSLFGFDFNEALWTFGGGTEISAATLIMISALAIAFATNKPSLERMSAVETWVALATVGLVLAPPFAPVLSEFIASSQIVGLATVVVQAGGFYALSYLG